MYLIRPNIWNTILAWSYTLQACVNICGSMCLLTLKSFARGLRNNKYTGALSSALHFIILPRSFFPHLVSFPPLALPPQQPLTTFFLTAFVLFPYPHHTTALASFLLRWT